MQGSVERWPLAAQQGQVMPITLRPVAMPLEQQALQRPVLLALERQAKHVVVTAHRQELARLLRVLLVDPTRQLSNAAALAEPP
ncbi:hypothetical protein D3C84_967450 [compost metagenome]